MKHLVALKNASDGYFGFSLYIPYEFDSSHVNKSKIYCGVFHLTDGFNKFQSGLILELMTDPLITVGAYISY